MIKSIKIVHHSWGLMSGHAISKHQININKNGALRYSLYNGMSKKAVQAYHYKGDYNSTRDFFQFIEPIVAKWDADYSVPVYDGFMWKATIRYIDGTVKNVKGTIEPPPRGNEIGGEIKNLVKHKVEPIIFM